MMLTFYPLDFVRERVEIDRRQKYPFLMKSDCLLTFFFLWFATILKQMHARIQRDKFLKKPWCCVSGV